MKIETYETVTIDNNKADLTRGLDDQPNERAKEASSLGAVRRSAEGQAEVSVRAKPVHARDERRYSDAESGGDLKLLFKPCGRQFGSFVK